MSDFIRKGDPTGKSSLVGQITKGLIRTSSIEKHSIHGSDAAFCSKKSVQHLGADEPDKMDLTPESTLYFAVGNAFHDAIHKALQNAGILIANEFSIKYGPIHGYIDDIIISAETGRLKIIDVKTCGKLPAKIKIGQYEQLLAYALLTGIPEASIVYASRNVSDYSGVLIKEIQAPINLTTMRQTARVVAESLVMAEHKVVPVNKPEYRLSRATCNWCPFKDNGCWSESDGLTILADGWSYGGYSEFEIEIYAKANQLMSLRNTFYAATLETR